jgi:di/tricarboxylate transporter
MIATEWFGLALITPLFAFMLKRLRIGLPIALAVALGGAASYILLRLTIMDPRQALTTAIFLVAYALLASEQIHQTTVALAAAVFMLLIGLIQQEEAFHGTEAIAGVDWNTIFLLIGMMIVINITRHTGLFQWLAIRAAKIARGEAVAVIIMISLVTAALSAVLDNVTTVLLIAPVTLLMCKSLNIDAVPPLIFVPIFQHRRHRHAHRRPSQHHDRLRRQAWIRGLPQSGWASHHRGHGGLSCHCLDRDAGALACDAGAAGQGHGLR